MGTNERLYKAALCLIVLSVVVVLTGCGGSTTKQDQRKPAAVPSAGVDDHKGHADADTAKGLGELSVADRAMAEKQKTCPVSGDLLGAMGKPVKITVKGQTVFLCCSGCEPAIKKDPGKYLAKLKAKEAK